eukprot:3287942-Alexandrium_andersonii.AAC.1
MRVREERRWRAFVQRCRLDARSPAEVPEEALEVFLRAVGRVAPGGRPFFPLAHFTPAVRLGGLPREALLRTVE